MKLIQQFTTHILPALLLSTLLWACNGSGGTSASSNGTTSLAIGANSKSIVTSEQSALLIYTTTDAWWGNLGGITGADEKCQADSQCPPWAKCQAVIADGKNRYACSSNVACGINNNKDWVLAPDQNYVNPDGSSFAATTGLAIFNNSWPNAKAWSGLNSNWTTAGDTCKSWTFGGDGNTPASEQNNRYGAINLSGKYASCSKYVDPKEDIDANKCYSKNEPYGDSSFEGCSMRHIVCAEKKPQCDQAASSGVYWYRCDKPNSDLNGADLSNANLYQANLSGANLTGANLENANLYQANLSGANLTGANLKNANLMFANLTGANLTGAILPNSDLLIGADFSGATWTDGVTICNTGYTGVCHFDIISVGKSTGGSNAFYNGSSTNVSFYVTNTQLANKAVESSDVWVNTSGGNLSATIVSDDCLGDVLTTNKTTCEVVVNVKAGNVDNILWNYVYFYINVTDSNNIKTTYTATPPMQFQTCPQGSYCHL